MRIPVLPKLCAFLFLAVAAGAVAAPTPPATLQTAMVQIGDTQGYLARPADHATHPAIIVIQEWWGLNDWIKLQARKLAEQGYVALAPDLYHGQVAEQPQDAMKLVRAFDRERGMAELQAAYARLRQDRGVRHDRIGVIGWCFGGGLAARLAARQPGLKAVVIYYGDIPADAATVARMTPPVLGNFGGADRNITPARVQQFAAAMKAAGHPADIKIYPGMPHAFAGSHDPGLLHNPDRNADVADAWRRTLTFFRQHLG